MPIVALYKGLLMAVSADELAKTVWRSHRGMLELDLMLRPFAKKYYDGLSPKQRAHFQLLLSCTDPEIFAWLMGHETPDSAELKSIVQLIKHHCSPKT